MNEILTRRGFARGLASALGACVVAPGLAGASAPSQAPAAARAHSGMPPCTVRIDSNENPYGPSPMALEAMSDSYVTAAYRKHLARVLTYRALQRAAARAGGPR